MTDWFKNADKAQTKRALVKGAPEGMKIVASQKHKAWKDPEAARQLVLERLGADGLDVPTPAQAIERGIPENVVNAMAPRPDGAPVLAFASDKRPEWRRSRPQRCSRSNDPCHLIAAPIAAAVTK